MFQQGTKVEEKRDKKNSSSTTIFSVSKDVTDLFIQLDEMDESFLKKAVSIIRQKFESAANNSVQVIDVDAIENEDEEISPIATPTEEPIDVDNAHALPNTTIDSIEPETPLEEAEAISTAKAPSPVQARKTIDSLIPLNANCFQKSGVHTQAAVRKAKSRAIAKLVVAIKDPTLSPEQQVLVLRESVLHRDLELISASAGIVKDAKLIQYLMNNIKLVLKLSTATTHTFGRASDDMRSIVQTIVLAMLPSPGSANTFSTREIANFIGLPKTTYLRCVKAVTVKRAVLEGIHVPQEPFIFSQVVRRKGWRKVDAKLKETTYDFIYRHPNIIASPIAGDTVTVPDPADSNRKIKVQKMLRQISIRELHNDLIKNVPACTKNGRVLLSNTYLLVILPPEVKKYLTAIKKCAPV